MKCSPENRSSLGFHDIFPNQNKLCVTLRYSGNGWQTNSDNKFPTDKLSVLLKNNLWFNNHLSSLIYYFALWFNRGEDSVYSMVQLERTFLELSSSIGLP